MFNHKYIRQLICFYICFIYYSNLAVVLSSIAREFILCVCTCKTNFFKGLALNLKSFFQTPSPLIWDISFFVSEECKICTRTQQEPETQPSSSQNGWTWLLYFHVSDTFWSSSQGNLVIFNIDQYTTWCFICLYCRNQIA